MKLIDTIHAFELQVVDIPDLTVTITITITTIPTHIITTPSNSLKMSRIVNLIQRSLPDGGSSGDASDSPYDTTRDSPPKGSRTLSSGSATALALSVSAIIILAIVATWYFVYWRPQKESRPSRDDELEIGDDGTKIKMQLQSQKGSGRWWGRRDSGESQDTLVPGEVTVPAGAVVRERSEA